MRGAILQSCNKFVGSRSGVNFIIPRYAYVLQGFIHRERFAKCITNECETPVHHKQFVKVAKYKLKCSHLTN